MSYWQLPLPLLRRSSRPAAWPHRTANRARPALLRVDVLNLFDDPLFIGPVSTFGTSNFGQITQVGGFARSLQFQARLGW